MTNGGEETDEGSYMLSADYFLTNEKGENTTAFGYGEDIILISSSIMMEMEHIPFAMRMN